MKRCYGAGKWEIEKQIFIKNIKNYDSYENIIYIIFLIYFLSKFRVGFGKFCFPCFLFFFHFILKASSKQMWIKKQKAHGKSKKITLEPSVSKSSKSFSEFLLSLVQN